MVVAFTLVQVKFIKARESDRAFRATMENMMKMMTQYMAQQSFFPPFPMGFQEPGPSQPEPPYPYLPMPSHGPPAIPTTRVSSSGPPAAVPPTTHDSSSEDSEENYL